MLTLPSFRAERCVRYRYTYSECSRCAEACPHEAVRLFEAGVELLKDRCQSCGLCVAVCPTDALQEKSVSSESLRKAAGSSKTFTIACAPSGARGDAVVPCLGAINPVTLADFSRHGIELHLAGTGYCTECAHGAKGPELIAIHLAARESLCAVALPEDKQIAWAALVVEEEGSNAAQQDEAAASRRQLFRRMVAPAVEAVNEAMVAPPPPPLKAIRAAHPFLPERKAVLNAMFEGISEEPLRAARHVAIPAENWVVAEGCTNCEACVRACPTGAMQLLEDNKAWRLVLLAERCVACDVCVEVCQPKVLHQRDDDTQVVNKQKGRLLRHQPRKRCATCDRLFVTETDAHVCPICSRDDMDFADIFG